MADSAASPLSADRIAALEEPKFDMDYWRAIVGPGSYQPSTGGQHWLRHPTTVRKAMESAPPLAADVIAALVHAHCMDYNRHEFFRSELEAAAREGERLAEENARLRSLCGEAAGVIDGLLEQVSWGCDWHKDTCEPLASLLREAAGEKNE